MVRILHLCVYFLHLSKERHLFFGWCNFFHVTLDNALSCGSMRVPRMHSDLICKICPKKTWKKLCSVKRSHRIPLFFIKGHWMPFVVNKMYKIRFSFLKLSTVLWLWRVTLCCSMLLWGKWSIYSRGLILMRGFAFSILIFNISYRNTFSVSLSFFLKNQIYY